MTAQELVAAAGLPALVRAPVCERALEVWVDPEVAFTGLVGSARPSFWLDGGPDAEIGWSYLGAAGPATALAQGDPDRGTVSLSMPGQRGRTVAGNIFDIVRATQGLVSAGGRGSGLGWVGYLGYESGARQIGVPFARGGGVDSALMLADRVMAFDHERRTVHLLAIDSREDSAAAWLAAAAAQLRGLIGRRPAPPPIPPALPAVRARHSPQSYRELIRKCQEHIAEGDAYQLCLTNRFETRTVEDPLTVYRRLRRVNPTAHGGYLAFGRTAVLGSSPETFLRVGPGGAVLTRPIKGTRRRGRDALEDARLREELRRDPKERAENVMIVDLMRNDLSQVAELGSVHVPELFAVEVYQNVHQLVSTVAARLSPGASISDLLAAAFPAGSMTGTPKARAMALLHDLESGPRGVYAGAYGHISANSTAELAMTIRTITITDGRASIGTGGGITALSDPDGELAETYLKIRPLLDALGARARPIPTPVSC